MRKTPVHILVAMAAALVAAGCGAAPHAQRPASAAATPTTSPTQSAQAAVASYPLTGLPVDSAARAARPALSVKIDNIDPALPQAGLNQADLVADILVEGGLTRLLATFQSHDAVAVGPVRSARPVDADLLRELGGGIFAYSGAAPGEIAPSKAHSTALLVSNDNDPHWFHRDFSRPAPHNVFSSTQTLYAAGHAMRPSLRAPKPLFTYSASVPANGAPASSVQLTFSRFASSGWNWNGSSYERTQDGRPDVLVGGARITTTNVVILSVGWRPTNIIDAAGNADPYVLVTGSGPAWVMRGGRVIKGRWTRPSYRQPVRLVDAAGAVIPLAPGRTWMELQPRPFTPTFA